MSLRRLLLLLLLFSPRLYAQEGAGGEAEAEAEEAWEELVIYGEQVWQARAALVAHIESLGYRAVRRSRGRTVYMPPRGKRWKPRIVVDDDGWMSLRSPNITFQGIQIGAVNGLLLGGQEMPGFAPPTGIQIGPRLWITSSRKLQAQETMLTEALSPSLAALRTLIARQAHAERLLVLSDALEATWAGPGTAAERRAQLLARWLACADTPEGAETRAMIEAFLEAVVQTSETPLLEAELQAARAACGCALLGAGPP